ncbi:MAG: DNA primase [Clostridiaceae bacterium]|nr:DNA primase [Clostridiaceae bacterium]
MESYFPEEIIEEIKEKNDVVDVIGQYLQLKSIGTSHKALCPFHNEKTPSFNVSREKQFFKCFGCGEGGDVIGFVMKMENLDFIEAVKLLAHRANIDIEFNAPKEEMKQKYNQQKKYHMINRLAGRYFYNNLTQRSNTALNYFKQRGLNIKIIKSFGLGYSLNNWNDLLNYLKKEGYSEKDIEESGLIVKSKNKDSYYDRFRNRIMFPIFDIRGNVIGFGGRVMDDSLPKYLNSPETKLFNKSETLYGLNIARKNIVDEQVILVEGYMDVIALHQEEFKNAVATLGTSLTKGHAILLKKYCKEVVICFDGDSAGVKATLRSIEILKDTGLNIKVLILPNKMDPDDYIKKMGKIVFKEAIEKAEGYIDYKIHLAQQQFASDSVEDKVKLGKSVAKILKEVKSPIEQEAYIKKIETKIGISKDAIMAEIYGRKRPSNIDNNKYSSNYKRNNKYIESVPIIEQKGHIIAEKQLIKYMLTNPQSISSVFQRITLDDFVLEEHRIIVEYTLNHADDSEKLEKIIDYLPHITKEIKDILNIDMKEMNINNALEKYKVDITKYQLLYKRNQLKQQQSQIIANENLNKEEVEKQLLKLGMEMMSINIELQKLQTEERREHNE